LIHSQFIDAYLLLNSAIDDEHWCDPGRVSSKWCFIGDLTFFYSLFGSEWQ